ncbi:MAG: hypothetical protein JJT76_13470 [Clostridiaceae bacterium]|nr:hypothetical protein [Clostridiaceae bacterium]
MEIRIRRKGNKLAKALSLIIFSMVVVATIIYYFLYNDLLAARNTALEEMLSIENVLFLLPAFTVLHIILLPLAIFQNQLCKKTQKPQTINTYSTGILQPKKKKHPIHYPHKQEA